MGRFLSEDPLLKIFRYRTKHISTLGGLLYWPEDLAQYVYVQNNPVNLKDPMGEFAIGPIIKIGGTVIAIAAIAVCANAVRKAMACCNEIPKPELPECPNAEDYLKYDQKMDIWRRRCLIHCWYRLVPKACSIFGAGPSPGPS